MATNIPFLDRSDQRLFADVDQPDISADELMEHIQGPDFPTGAVNVVRESWLIALRQFMCALKPMLKQTNLAATALLSLKYPHN